MIAESLSPLIAAIGINVERYHSFIEDPRALVEHLRAASDASDDEVVLEVLACVLTGDSLDESPARLHRIAAWARGNTRSSTIVLAWMARRNGAALARLMCSLIKTVPTAVPLVAGAAVFLDEDQKLSVLLSVASHSEEAAREHLFALLGTHRRLVPPGTISQRSMPDSVLIPLLEVGLRDAAPKVRVRAIAYAYGIGAVEKVRPFIMANLQHKDGEVRGYALLSLGVMHDRESLDVLVDRVNGTAREDAVSALWALARRSDGIQHVLALANNPDFAVDVISAVAEVSTPLGDGTLEKLRSLGDTATTDAAIRRHLLRTREGAPEAGPDGRVEYLVKRR